MNKRNNNNTNPPEMNIHNDMFSFILFPHLIFAVMRETNKNPKLLTKTNLFVFVISGISKI